jgi:hypothetical protein
VTARFHRTSQRVSQIFSVYGGNEDPSSSVSEARIYFPPLRAGGKFKFTYKGISFSNVAYMSYGVPSSVERMDFIIRTLHPLISQLIPIHDNILTPPVWIILGNGIRHFHHIYEAILVRYDISLFDSELIISQIRSFLVW